MSIHELYRYGVGYVPPKPKESFASALAMIFLSIMAIGVLVFMGLCWIDAFTAFVSR